MKEVGWAQQTTGSAGVDWEEGEGVGKGIMFPLGLEKRKGGDGGALRCGWQEITGTHFG